jgi:hypothetical protein
LAQLCQETGAQLSSSPMPMLHVKIEIANCYVNANINFTDSVYASLFGLFAPTANAAAMACIVYDNEHFAGTINPYLCEVNISDFTWPLRGGIGDILTITGTNFGTTKGAGKVTFKNADNNGQINDLNTFDYVSWSNTQIKIRMPSRVDSLIGKPTPGGGNFIVTNNAGGNANSGLNAAGKTFEIYYSIATANRIAPSTGQLIKPRVNLLKKNGQGGYTIRLNPIDFPVGSVKRGCVIRAIQDWKCLTGANFVIGADTSINYQLNTADGINYIFLASPTQLAMGEAARTINAENVCQSNANSNYYFGAKQEFDMMINNGITWYADTTGQPVPGNQGDLYACYWTRTRLQRSG